MKKQNKKILLVEDSDELKILLSNQLAGEDITIIKAKDGEEGLEKVLSEKPDLIILDILMPRKTGIEMLNELHKQDPKDSIPVIILSNSKDMQHMAEAASHNVVAYLLKSDQELQKITSIVKEKLGL